MEYTPSNHGIDAVTFWEQVVRRRPEIAALAVFRYIPLPALQLRLGTNATEQQVVLRAKNFAEESRIPFWDAVLLEATKTDELTDSLLDAVSVAHPATIEPVFIDRQPLLDGALRAHTDATAGGTITAMLSEVLLDSGRKMHFPMIDFRCAANPAGLRAAEHILRRLLPNGATLLLSGRSYHAVGRELKAAKDLRQFLISSLFYCPIVDRQYIAHHLCRGVCTLRISANNAGNSPITVAET